MYHPFLHVRFRKNKFLSFCPLPVFIYRFEMLGFFGVYAKIVVDEEIPGGFPNMKIELVRVEKLSSR